MNTKTIGIIGAPCIDEIISPRGELTSRQLGGILYSYAAMERLARDEKLDITFYPFTFIAERDNELLEPFFAELTHFDFSFAPRHSEALSNRVRLIYSDETKRSEQCGEILPELLPEHFLIDRLRMLDGLFVNMISGFDISLETMEWIRRETNAHIHLDVHALTLGPLAERGRRYEPVKEWHRWALAADSVQLNQNEALYFPPRSSTPYIEAVKSYITDDRQRSVVITRAERGCIAYDISSAIKYTIESEKLVTVGTTGSGDVFGGIVAVKLAMHAGLEEAIHSANYWAGKNTQIKGVFELLNAA